jgi:hypothetical protein
VQKVLLDRFISALYIMLHISEDEGRAWFQSELDLDMPVLKIYPGASIEKMVEDAFGRLSPELTPELKREGKVVEVEAVQEKVAPSEETYQSETLLSSMDVSDNSSSDEEGAWFMVYQLFWSLRYHREFCY